MYEVGDKVIYPIHGVGDVQKIEEKSILKEKNQYYIIRFHRNSMKVMIPVNNAFKLGLRHLSEPDELEKIWSRLEEKELICNDNWKQRYLYHQKKLKRGTLVDLAEIVRNLFITNQKKELSLSERKLFESAIRLLVEEIHFCTTESKESVYQKIVETLKIHKKNKN